MITTRKTAITMMNWINSDSGRILTTVSFWLRWPRVAWRSRKTSRHTWGCTAPAADSSAAVAVSRPPRSCQSRRCCELLGTVWCRTLESPTCTPLHKYVNTANWFPHFKSHNPFTTGPKVYSTEYNIIQAISTVQKTTEQDWWLLTHFYNQQITIIHVPYF